MRRLDEKKIPYNFSEESDDILIVDDDEEVREILKEFVEHHGYHAITSENAMKALKFLQKKKFNIIITDYSMPDMNGIELITLIKKKYPHIKIVGISGANKEELFYEAGADYFLKKPFNFNKLKEIISSKSFLNSIN